MSVQINYEWTALPSRWSSGTRTLRQASQLPLGSEEGLPAPSVANFDDLASAPKALLVRRIGDLDDDEVPA